MIDSYIVMAGTTKIRTIQFNSHDHIYQALHENFHPRKYPVIPYHTQDASLEAREIYMHTHNRPGNYSDHTHTQQLWASISETSWIDILSG